MKTFSVIGMKRREFRGNFQPMTLLDEIEAENKQAAVKKFETANPEYTAQDVNEMSSVPEKKTKKETGTSGSKAGE